MSGFQSKTIAEGMNKWPIANVSSVTEALELVNAGNYVLITQDDDNAAARLSENYCDILVMSEGLSEVSAHFVFREDNPLIHKFNEVIGREKFAIMRIVKRYFANADAQKEQLCGRAKDARKAPEARPLGKHCFAPSPPRFVDHWYYAAS
ncbi:Protein W02A2.5 [Aphelenchoides avenae]|nr:Protein W02A2.5 [Aphelenchus avenae]